ncbi:MAG: TOBE domain-containing protein [Methylophilus sp.]|nr:TOBE domain-containing protein [Methylophilus sp.]
MNKLTGNIITVTSNQYMSLIDVKVGDDIFTATLLETPETASYLAVGNRVSLMFKETEVSLAKHLTGELSLRNRITVTIQKIERGDILSAITLDYYTNTLVSVVTTRAVDRLQLNAGDQVEALIKANEVVLSHDL